MPKRSKRSYAQSARWKRWVEAAKEGNLSIPRRMGKSSIESPVTWRENAAGDVEGEERSASPSVEEDKGESATSAVYGQEVPDAGRGPSATDDTQTARGEAAEVPEPEACAPLCEEEWYAPITEDLLSSSAEDSDCSLEGSNAEETRGGGNSTLAEGQEKPFSCDVCGKRYKTTHGLGGHRRVHTGETPYGCASCGRRFRQRFQLRAHEAEQCCGGRLDCAVCGEVLATAASLEAHRRVHAGERPHACVSCGKRFRTPANLRRHLPVHSQSKRLRCAACGKKLKNLHTLRSHEIIHTGSTPHTCASCGESFRWRIQLKRHLQSHRVV